MRRAKQVLLITVLLVLCAGVVLGRLSAHLPAGGPRSEHSPSWLADTLGLSTDQRQKMDAVWADVNPKMSRSWHSEHDLDRQRDEAVHNLLTSEQRAAFDKIYDDYRVKRQDMEKERYALIHDAEERSRALLDESQQKQWDVLSKELHNHHGPHGPGDPSSQRTGPNMPPEMRHGMPPGMGPGLGHGMKPDMPPGMPSGPQPDIGKPESH